MHSQHTPTLKYKQLIGHPHLECLFPEFHLLVQRKGFSRQKRGGKRKEKSFMQTHFSILTLSNSLSFIQFISMFSLYLSCSNVATSRSFTKHPQNLAPFRSDFRSSQYQIQHRSVSFRTYILSSPHSCAVIRLQLSNLTMSFSLDSR